MSGDLLGLQAVQIGTESTWGTAVTPTAKAMGVDDCKIKSTGGAQLLKDLRGSLSPAMAAIRTKNGAQAAIKGWATYEDLNYYLESLFGTVTPTGAGPYVRAGNAPLTSIASNRALTVVNGQSTEIYKLAGGIVTKLNIAGKVGEPVTFSADMIGKSKSTGSLAALSDRTVNPIEAGDISLYIDAWGGTIGTTQINTLATAFDLTLDLASALRFYLGSLTPGRYRQQKPDLGANVLKLTLELDTASKAYLDTFLAYAAVLQHQIRIKATTGASAIAQFDFAGTLIGEPEATEDDGVIMLDLTYNATYNTGLANWFKYSITNQVATLP